MRDPGSRRRRDAGTTSWSFGHGTHAAPEQTDRLSSDIYFFLSADAQMTTRHAMHAGEWRESQDNDHNTCQNDGRASIESAISFPATVVCRLQQLLDLDELGTR